MNRIYKRIWNAVRGCSVVVSELAGSGQTRGCGKKTVVASAVCLHIDADIKRLVVFALAWAVCSCFALPTHASWITDHGGVKNELTWTVGTDGTTTWKPLQNQEFEILKGETLNVGSKGSNYSEAGVPAISNLTAGNRITNRGTYKINWTGNKIQANAENEGNFLDNYGTVAIVMNQTPNFGAENTRPNGMQNHNMAAWEIYRWNMNGVDAAWLKEKPAFYNRQGAEFIIDVNVDSSKLTSDKDATKFGSSITGIAINGSGDRAGMAGKNAGHIKVDIENAGSKTYGLYLRQKGNAFTNEKTGVFDIGTTYKKPADNFLDPTLLPYAVGIKLGSSAELRNEGTFNIDVAGNRAYGISIGDSASSTSHLVNAAGGTFALKTKANSKNAKDYAILFDVETDAIIDNYGTMTGTATALGTHAQGIGFFNAGGRFNNYAGAKLDLTAMAQATNESAVKVYAKGIYLNGMEQFVNNGSATLSAIVDGAGTDKVTNGWAIDARDANTQVVNNKELNLNYTGALGGGVYLIKGATFSNNATATITVNRPVNEVVRTGLTGIRALNTSTITNAGNLSISMTGVAPTTTPNESRNQGGDMTGLYVAGTDDSIISLSNKKNSKLDINVSVSNAAEGQTNGIRPYGMILSSHAKNEGTMDVTVTGNYGKVTSDYGVFAAMGFNIDGENASKETALAHPRIENSGLMKANVSFNAQGMTPTLDPAKAKGWATGLNMHGTATLVNSGTLQSKATSTVNAKAASIQGSELINNKDAAFEAEATGNGSFAAAFQVGRPNADMVEIPSYVLNDVNGTLTLTAKSPIGSSYGIYESAGKVENKGMLTVTAEGRDANGISLSNEDLERRDGSNPEFNNSGTLTVHANAMETVPTMYHEAQALLLKAGSFVNSGTLDAFATASGLAEGMKISDASFTNQKGGILNLTVKSNQTVWQDGLAGGISIAPNSNVVNAGTINIDMESHAHFIKGFSFGDKSSTLTNTGTIKILGTNFGDGTHVKEPTLKDTKNAYGMYLNGGEKFANDGTLIIGVNALKGVSMGIAAHDAEIANNAGGKMNITVKAYEQEAFGIDVYGASGCGNNAGTISFDATAGTTDNALARVIFLRNRGFFANTGTLDFKLRGTTDSASSADVMAADITGANTKFNNQGLVEISGNRTSAGASGDVLGLRVNNGATLDNTATGSIDIALGPTGNHKYANNFGISVFDKAAFGNAGTVGIALNQEAGNLGTLYGLKLGADAVVNNSATGTIKIDVSPEAVGSSHAWAIHGDSAMIKNYGLIETNGAISLGSILGTASNANGGILKLTGKDAVSTVTGQLCLGTIENAGKLTVGSVYSKTGTDVSLKAYDLLNTGTLNTDSGWFMNSVTNEGSLSFSTTNKSIALIVSGKELASGEHLTILNKKDALLNITAKPNAELSAKSTHVAGIDLFSPIDKPTMTGGDFINYGTATITVVGERGNTHGIIADSAHASTIQNDGKLTIDVTKTAADAAYNTFGIKGNHDTTLLNNGSLEITGTSTAERWLVGMALYGTASTHGNFKNSGTSKVTLKESALPVDPKNGNIFGYHSSWGTGTNTGSMTFDLAGYRSTGMNVDHSSSFLNQGDIAINIKPTDHSSVSSTELNSGLNRAMYVSESTFTNDAKGTMTVKFLNEDAGLTTAFSDGFCLRAGGKFTNAGLITFELKDLGSRKARKWMKVISAAENTSFINDGIFNVISETNKAEEAFDAVLANDGTFINRNQLTFNVLSHESTRQLYAGHGKLHNEGTFEATVTNAGRGDVVGFMRDWDDKPAQYTLSVRNEKTMNLTLKASNGSADLFAMLGKERFVNGASGVVRANVSAGTSANGWMLSDTTSFENGNELNLTLTGLKSTSKLIGLSSLNAGAVATNGGSLNLKLTGKGAEAYGLKSSVAEALFTNNGTLSIESTGTFGKVSAIDWAGKIANTGTIKTELGVKLGSLTNTGRVSTADMMVTGSIQNDRNAVMQIGTLKTKDGKTKIRNDGTLSISNAENRVTVQNTGVLAIGSFKNVSVQNKGTLVTDEVKIGGLDRLVNGGTIVANKFKSNGTLINRDNGQLVIGIVAKTNYLMNHLEVAKELYEAGESLPASVLEKLKAQGMIPAEAAEGVALMILSRDDRALSDEEDAIALADNEDEGEAPAADEPAETAESTDTSSSASETNAPVRTLEDLIRESRERAAREAARVHRTIPTTVGALTSAARGAASQTMASIESQAQAAVTGLWADAGYGKTEFDAYRTDRSGLLFGVQGSTETLTLGAVLSAGTGNVKSDNLASQDWNDVGGSVYGAYRFGPAALTASALYERHEGKAQGQKRHADVLGASAKVSVDAMLGGMTVTPYAGWRVLGLDHEDAANRVVVHELPVGIKAVGSFEAGSWRISPSADVAYVPTFGDKKIRIDGTNTKSVVAGDNAMTYKVGISAEKNRLSLGLSYVGTTGDCGLRGHSVRGNLRFAF